MSIARNSSTGGIFGSVSAATIIEYTSFSQRLNSIDQFLDAGLFLTLMGIGLAAAGLFSSAASQRLIAANGTFAIDHSQAIKMKDEAHAINNGANQFLASVFPAMLGFLNCIAFDGFMEITGKTPSEGMKEILQLLDSEWQYELFEAVLGSAFLGATIVLFIAGFKRVVPAFQLRG